jgi:hypothetical protein
LGKEVFHRTETPKFKKWIELEKLKSDFISDSESEAFPDRVFAYLSASLSIPVKKLEKKSWEETVKSLLKEASRFSPNRDLPMLKDAPKDSGEKVQWDYPNRTWNYYSHLLAQAYGWTLEYIAELDVDEALAHLQEILTDEHLEHEFVYSLSEIAYPYSKQTKTSHFKPMKRPYWMRVAVKPIQKMRMRRDLLPVGAGVDLSGMPAEYGIKEMIESGQRQ